MGIQFSHYDTVILAADVGGTNTNLALVGKQGDRYDKILERRFATQSEPSFEAPVSRFLAEALEAGHPYPRLFCASGAGPVTGRSIALTNAPWGIDGAALESRFGLPCYVINDFSAVAWGVLLLDPEAPGQLLALKRPDGGMAERSPDGLIAVLGAGTGLGCGFITRDGSRPRVYPSEGGHVGIPVYDADSRAFSLWLEAKYGFAAGTEAGVSGQGIANLFQFLAGQESRRNLTVTAILDAKESERPAMVAAAAGSDALCAKAMDMFVRLYARAAADLAAMLLPSGGLFLAGGIAAKNEAWFADGNRFMETFLGGYREHVRLIARSTPVYIVRDYGISIYGAAHAAAVLSAG